MDVAGAFEDRFDVAGWESVFVGAIAQDGLFPQAEVDAVVIGAGFGWQCGFGAIEGRLDAVAGHGAGLQSAAMNQARRSLLICKGVTASPSIARSCRESPLMPDGSEKLTTVSVRAMEPGSTMSDRE